MIDARPVDRRRLGLALGGLAVAVTLVLVASSSATGQENGLEDGEIAVTLTQDRNDVRLCDMHLDFPEKGAGCSLREAVLIANDDEYEIDTVVLGEATYVLSIAGAAANDGMSGDLHVTDDLTIRGAGSDATEIVAEWDLDAGNEVEAQQNGDDDGAPSPDRLLQVPTSGTNLTLEHLTLAGGAAAQADGDEPCDETRTCHGGAILLGGALDDASTLGAQPAITTGVASVAMTTEDVVIRDSFSDRDGGGIAAIANEVTLTLDDTTVSGNEADRDGGGIAVNAIEATLTVDDSRIGADEAVVVAEGIDVPDDGNVAGRDGGGLHVFATDVSVEVTDSHVGGNAADANGGGVSVRAQGDEYRLNGQDVAAAATGEHVTFSNSVVAGNYSDNEGGGLALGGVDAHLDDTDVTANAARGDAGVHTTMGQDRRFVADTQEAEEAEEADDVRHLLVTGGSVEDNMSFWGSGGISTMGVHLTMHDALVAGNEGQEVGGLFVIGDAHLERVDLRDNSGSGVGGMAVIGGDFGPGGLLVGDLTVVDSSVTGNQGHEAAGGIMVGTGVYAAAGIAGEEAVEPDYDSAPRTYEVTIAGSTLAGNQQSMASGWDGASPARAPYHSPGAGALWITGQYHGTVTNSTFSGNEAAGAGAGLRATGLAEDGLDVTHVTFADNELLEAVTPMLENGSDPEPGPRGAAIHVDDDEDVYITDDGGSDAGDVRLSHTILSGDGENCADIPGDRLVSAGHNLDDDGTCGLDAEGDVEAAALLGDLADNDGPTLTHLPEEDSPAVDGGQADPCEVDTDQRGVSRAQGDACDIGAVEVEVEPEDPVEPDPDPEDPIDPDPERPFGCDPDAADGFSDVVDSYVHRDAIGCLADLGFVVGFEDGTYGPNLDMSRGQFATVVSRMIEFIADEELDDDGPSFADVPDHHVHAEGINKLAAAGLIRGFEDGSFRPGDRLERGQAASILDAAITLATGQQLPDGPNAFFDDDGSPHEDALDRLAQEGIVVGFGEGLVRPNDEIKRGQLASMVVRTLVTIEGLTVGAE
jgi:hypothetical protein